MRVLVPIRVSRDTDEGSSPESQKDGAHDYRDTRPGTELIFCEGEDLGVSGATAIATRPSIAPWLKRDKLRDWDAIGVYEVDRLSRNMEDYLGFVRAMDKVHKIIIDLIDGTDTSTPEGRRTLEDRVLAAQRYREMVAEKRARAAKRASDAGRWSGGRIPFGYVPERREYVVNGKTKLGYFLVKHDERAPIARRMALDAINGKPLLRIAQELNAQGIKTPIGRAWHDNVVRRVLTSPALMGYVVKMVGAGPDSKHKNIITVRRDRDDQPIKFTEDPILTPDEWRKLQDAMDSRGRKRGQPQARHLLWGVAYCRNCSVECEHDLPCAEHDVKLYGARRHKNVRKSNFYYCKRCYFSCRLERLEAYVNYRVMTEAGKNPLLEYVTDSGDDFSAEIIKHEKRIQRWRMDLDTEYDEALEQAIENAQKKIKKLIDGSREPREPKLVPVVPPTTIGEHWASLDTQGRNRFLRDTGAWFYADRDGVMGLLGWMGVDDPAYALKELRALKMPDLVTWKEIDEMLEGR
jgi:site-specific DNA recombinase